MTLIRSAELGEIAGRTLEGPAFRYDVPSRVTDDGWRTSYYEEMARRCEGGALGPLPFHRGHADRGGPAIGEVVFRRSVDERALMFTAVVARGPAGDRALAELDEWRDVSVGFDELATRMRSTPHHGPIYVRTRIELAELALSPTGLGLHDGAEVLVVRSAEPDAAAQRLARMRRQRARLVLPSRSPNTGGHRT